MRCYCCNNILTTQENTRRFKESGAFTEMCTPCLNTLDDSIDTVDGEYQGEEKEEDDET